MTRDEQSAIKEMKYVLKHYQKEKLDISISTIRVALGCIDKLQKENKEIKKNTYKVFINEKGELKFIFDNYINKDKIKNKIEQLEAQLEGDFLSEDYGIKVTDNIIKRTAQIDVLSELLKE